MGWFPSSTHLRRRLSTIGKLSIRVSSPCPTSQLLQPPRSLNRRRSRPQVVPRETPRPVAAEPRVEPRQVFREEPVSPISGPSFLGLSSDPTATADYLLEEEPRKGGAFRFPDDSWPSSRWSSSAPSSGEQSARWWQNRARDCSRLQPQSRRHPRQVQTLHPQLPPTRNLPPRLRERQPCPQHRL